MTVEEVRSYTTWAISNYNEHKLDKKYLNQFTIIIYALFRLDKIYEVVKQFIILQLTDRIKTSQHHGQQIIGKFSDENEPATTNLINVRERVLFIGTQFSILYTFVYSQA